MPRDTLANIDPAKRERVLREAALLFAERGYAATDMAQLAQRIGISKGSIYTYFDSKEELYLYVCRDGLERSRAFVWGEVEPGWDIYRLVDHVFRRGLEFTRQFPEYIGLYLAVATPGMGRVAEEMSVEVEKPTADHLADTIAAGIAGGVVRDDVDPRHAAWLINNQYVMLLAPLVSRHFQVRLSAYLGVVRDLTDEDQDRHLQRTIDLIHETLRPAGERDDREEHP